MLAYMFKIGIELYGLIINVLSQMILEIRYVESTYLVVLNTDIAEKVPQRPAQS